MRESQAVARRANLLVLPLHGDLSPAEQDRAIMPAEQRKVILATNVAESSVTVEGVNAVIDSGLARIAVYPQWTGLPTLHVGRVSKASAQQRAGRAGRTGRGRVVRLYGIEDYQRRRNTMHRRSRAATSPSFALLCGRWESTTSNGWMPRRSQHGKAPRLCSIAWARQKSGCISWRGIRCIHGYRAFLSRLWSAG